MPAPMPEADVPDGFNTGVDEAGVPQRELVDFTVLTTGARLVSVCELDEPRKAKAAPMRAVGKLVAADGGTMRTESADLTEMCIEYSTEPVLWVRSETAWYKLGRPSAEYARTHDLARRRFELCSRIYILITSFPDQDSFKVFSAYLAGPWSTMQGYTEKEILAERSFILAQMEQLNEKVLNESTFLKELRAKKAPGGVTSPKALTVPAKVFKKKKPVASSPSADALSSKAAVPWVPRTEGLDVATQLRLLKRMTKALGAAVKMKKAAPFLQPVNPATDGCPDYLTRVNRPMDYGTISKRLEAGVFYDSVADVVADVRLVRQNCVQYNGEGHMFSKYAQEVEKKFEKEARAAEEAEIKTMQKRQNPASNGSGTAAEKKRRVAAAVGSEGGGDTGSEGGIIPTGRKPPTSGKGRFKKSSNASPGSIGGDECISTATGAACGKRARPGSRYCGDDCGLAVARKKLRILLDEGEDIDAHIARCLGTALVRANPLNA
jgi:Bromodomain/Cytosine specific DNA methyltransferase replication foci domain